MLKASERAGEIGREKLSEMLQKEVEDYKNPNAPVVNAQYVYEKIGDAIMDAPDASFESIIKWIARDIGAYPEEVEKNYKMCRRIYEKEVKRSRHIRETQAELRKKLEAESVL